MFKTESSGTVREPYYISDKQMFKLNMIDKLPDKLPRFTYLGVMISDS